MYLASCPWFLRNEEQRWHAWQNRGMGQRKSHRIRPTALLASTDDHFQWECTARISHWLHAALLAQYPRFPGACEAGGSSGEGEPGEIRNVTPCSLIGSCRGWPVSAPITLEKLNSCKNCSGEIAGDVNRKLGGEPDPAPGATEVPDCYSASRWDAFSSDKFNYSNPAAPASSVPLPTQPTRAALAWGQPPLSLSPQQGEAHARQFGRRGDAGIERGHISLCCR